MRQELTQLIDSNRDRLTQQLDSDGTLLNRLVSLGVINSDHLADIKAEKTLRRRNEALLDILKLQDDKFFEIFKKEVMRQQAQLAQECLYLTDGASNEVTAVKESS